LLTLHVAIDNDVFDQTWIGQASFDFFLGISPSILAQSPSLEDRNGGHMSLGDASQDQCFR
jgi:hypothetical protein